MRNAALIALTLLGTACSAIPGAGQASPVSTPAAALISREKAIAVAVASVSVSRPEVSPALVPPGNIHAEQITLAQAEQSIPGSRSLPAGYTAGAPVWYITLDGLCRTRCRCRAWR